MYKHAFLIVKTIHYYVISIDVDNGYFSKIQYNFFKKYIFINFGIH